MFFPENPSLIHHSSSYIRMSLINAPINITTNAQLATYASTGNGSQENPYIIENAVINGYSNITGVSIQNTNKYFILRNITVSNCSSGFSLNNVTFGSIMNSSAINDNFYGFYLNFSSNVALMNNLVIHGLWGFRLSFSSNNTLVHNIVTNSSGIGFVLDYFSSNNTLIGNTSNNISIGNTVRGIIGFGLDPSCPTNLLIGNIAKGNIYGFGLYGPLAFNVLFNNTAINNVDGFLIRGFSNNNLTSNVATNNVYVGFDLEFSSNNSLINNIATENAYGFYVNTSSYNIFKSNIAHYNHLSDYYSRDSPNNTFIDNTFSNSPTTFFDIIETLTVLGLILLSIIIFARTFLYLHARKKSVIRSQIGNKITEPNTEYKSGKDAATAIASVEEILKEEYRAPDYETAVKIHEGRFPDYPTYKQALDKGIITYAEWLKYQKQN